MNKVFRTVRISDGVVESIVQFLKTTRAENLGLYSVKDVIEYYARKGMEEHLDSLKNPLKTTNVLKNLNKIKPIQSTR